MTIKSVLNKAHVPVKLWTDIASVESGALDQLTNTANLPFVFKHVAVMPDVHLGKGATVGSVVATKGAICPAAVGVDIGCGMQAVPTGLHFNTVEPKLSEIRSAIEQAIPVGHLGNAAVPLWVRKWFADHPLSSAHMDSELTSRAQAQFGSLGGGNHFIEICRDQNDSVWIMLHSGSRNVGKSLAERYIDDAKGLMKQMFISLPDPDLSYFVEGTTEFTSYLDTVMWAQEYARGNRDEMMRRIKNIFGNLFPLTEQNWETIDCHHNYVARENHFGQNVLVTRKGAVRARTGDLCIIPGSMGTKSYIARGLGNSESFNSCSHGAGRRMSRGAAKKAFTLADLEAQTAGVNCRKDAGVLDEIPGAYKDIDTVMENQNDLVQIQEELKQVVCIKG